MKKALSILMALALLTVPALAFAEDGGMNAAQELTALWADENYPDDVGGIFYDNVSEKCGVLLTSLSDARESEIRTLVSDPDSVFFVACSYSFGELLAVQHEIEDTYLPTGELSGVGIGWLSGDGGVTGFGESGYEMRVTVNVRTEYYDQYAALFGEMYGDKVYVEASGPIVPADDSAQAAASPTPDIYITPMQTGPVSEVKPDIVLYILISLVPATAIVIGIFWLIRFKEKHIDGK